MIGAREKTSLVLITPIYSDFTPEHTISMLELFRAARARSWDVALPELLYQQGSLVVHGRNELAAQFLDNTTAEWAVWADGDMRYDGELPCRMIEAGRAADEDFIGIAYQSRDDRLVFGGTDHFIDEHGLMLVDDFVGFGVVAMHRRVLEKFREAKMFFREEPGPRVEDHVGEDVCFCRDYRTKLGGTIHLFADADVGHVGRVVFRGTYAPTCEP